MNKKKFFFFQIFFFLLQKKDILNVFLLCRKKKDMLKEFLFRFDEAQFRRRLLFGEIVGGLLGICYTVEIAYQDRTNYDSILKLTLKATWTI